MSGDLQHAVLDGGLERWFVVQPGFFVDDKPFPDGLKVSQNTWYYRKRGGKWYAFFFRQTEVPTTDGIIRKFAGVGRENEYLTTRPKIGNIIDDPKPGKPRQLLLPLE